MPSDIAIGVSASQPAVTNREPGNEVTRLLPLVARGKELVVSGEGDSSFSAKNEVEGQQKFDNPPFREDDKVSSDSVVQEVGKLQELAVLKGWSVNFKIDDDSGKMVIKLLDKDSQKVIRQIPSDELLAISRRLKELADSSEASAGLMIDSRV